MPTFSHDFKPYSLSLYPILCWFQKTNEPSKKLGVLDPLTSSVIVNGWVLYAQWQWLCLRNQLCLVRMCTHSLCLCVCMQVPNMLQMHDQLLVVDPRTQQELFKT